MRHHIKNKIYHVEITPTKQDTEKLEADLALFAEKYKRVMESGYCACLTDKAMDHLKGLCCLCNLRTNSASCRNAKL